MTAENIQLITGREDFYRGIGWENFLPLQEALYQIDFQSTLSIDTEVTGLGSFMKEKCFALQIGFPGTQMVFDLESITGGLKIFKRPLEEKELIIFNAAFDLIYLNKEGIAPRLIYDPFGTEKILWQGMDDRAERGKNLAATLFRHLGIVIDKSQQEFISQGLNSVESILYSGRDVLHLPDLKEEQLKTVARRQSERRVKFEHKYTIPMVYQEYSGLMVDKDEMLNYFRDNEADEIIALRKLKEYADINWNSSLEVPEVLKKHGIEHYSEDTGNAATGTDILKKYDIPIAQDLMTYRKAGKLVSTYGRKWIHFVQSDGRIHTKYKQFTSTGRTSCGEVDRTKYDPWDLDYKVVKAFPNLQNIPPSMRKVFIPKRGNVFVDADYSGQETIILADQSEEENLMKFFREKEGDLHCEVVRYVYPETANLSDDEIKEKHSDKRTLCKTASFAIAYGGNGQTIAENLNVDRTIGDDVFNRFMTAFPGLKHFFDKCFDFTKKYGYMPTDFLTGGKRYFDNAKEFMEKANDKTYWRKYYDEKNKDSDYYKKEKDSLRWYFAMNSSLRKESVNSRIQGTAAVMTKLATIYFYDWIVNNDLWGKVLIPLSIHDQLLVECPKKLADKVAVALQKCMEKAGKDCLKHLTIKAKPKITERWTK